MLWSVEYCQLSKRQDIRSRAAREVRRQRLDHARKAASALVRDRDVIVREDLKIGNMPARRKQA
jgi:transposase